MKTRILAIAIALALNPGQVRLAAAMARTAEGAFDRTLKTTGPVELDIQTGAGGISVKTGPSDSVRVQARIRANTGWFGGDADALVRQIVSNPPIEQNGNSIRIGRLENRSWWHSISISYEVLTPPDTRLHSSSGSGGQTIAGLRGPVTAETGSGGLVISDIEERVTATAGSGGIQLNALHGPVRATTGSGGIRALAIAGGLTARTGSGGIRVELTAPGDVDVLSGSGRIELTGLRGGLQARCGSGGIKVSGEPASPWNVRAGSGGIRLELPDQAAFDLSASTASGRITVDHPITVQGVIGRRQVTGAVRGGGPLVALSTGSGGIQIQ